MPSNNVSDSILTKLLYRLVELSAKLELDEELMTPAQAYSAIRETVPNESYLQPTLEALKKPLASQMECRGFGACMDTAT